MTYIGRPQKLTLRMLCSRELTRAVRQIKLSEQVSLQEVKAVGKWVVTREEGGVKQTICVWFHLPNFICQCYHGLLFKKCYNLNDSTFIKFVFEFVIKPSFSIIQLSINRKERNYGLGLRSATYM